LRLRRRGAMASSMRPRRRPTSASRLNWLKSCHYGEGHLTSGIFPGAALTRPYDHCGISGLFFFFFVQLSWFLIRLAICLLSMLNSVKAGRVCDPLLSSPLLPLLPLPLALPSPPPPPLPPFTALLFGNNLDSRGGDAYRSLSAVVTLSTKDLVDRSMVRQLSATILGISLKDTTAMVAERWKGGE